MTCRYPAPREDDLEDWLLEACGYMAVNTRHVVASMIKWLLRPCYQSGFIGLLGEIEMD